MNTQTPDFPTLKRAQTYCGRENIVPLDAISQPLVAELQNCIRAQQQLLGMCEEAAVHWLAVNRERFATQSEANFITIIANIRHLPRADISRLYCAHHDARSHYGCVDDPPMNTGEEWPQ